MKFIHLTDTHLVAPTDNLHGLNPKQRLDSCVEGINQAHADAECCVLTGDLAHNADNEAYELLIETLRQLSFPVHLVLGNHDSREKFIQYFPQTPVDSNGFIQYAVKTSDGVFIILDTVMAGSASGEYCEARQAWLHETLAHYADEPVYLFMHHPPFDIQLPSMDSIGLVDKVAFEEIVRPFKNIRHIFFGHVHRPVSGSWQGIAFSSLRGTNHQVYLDFEAAEVTFVDEPAEYSVVFISEQTTVVHTHSMGVPEYLE